MFTCVLAVGNTETKFEVEGFEQSVPEEMPFYHSKLFNSLFSYDKLNPVVQ